MKYRLGHYSRVCIDTYIDVYLDMYGSLMSILFSNKKRLDPLTAIQKACMLIHSTTLVTPESNFYSDLGFDYRDVMSLVSDVGSRLNIQIPTDEIKEVKTVGDLISIINKTYYHES